MSELSDFELSLKYYSIYTCNRCGKRQEGTTIRYSSSGRFLDHLEYIIKNLPHCPENMPIGWIHNGSEIYLCEDCKESTND